jgi:ABC-type branched-subunit amino acid transport system ATPase component
LAASSRSGTPAEIRENADVRRAYLGDEAEMGA